LSSQGAQALEQLRRAPPPALLLLDLRMPVMDGWSLLEARRRDPTLLLIPVIAVSAEPNIEDKVLEAGAGYLRKPISREQLLAMVTTVSQTKVPSQSAPPPPA
jgi:CheY-like chemotaxis protein